MDAAIVDGTAHLSAMFASMLAGGTMHERRASGGLLDGGAPYYDLYETADHKHMSVGPLEPQFYGGDGQEPNSSTARTGPRRASRSGRGCGRCWTARFQGSARRPSGPRSSTARTLASRPCCRSPRRRGTRTWQARGTYVDRDGRIGSRPRRRGSRAPRPRWTTGPSRAGGDTREALEGLGRGRRRRPAGSPAPRRRPDPTHVTRGYGR